MRISFNPSVMNMRPLQPINRVVRHHRSVTSGPAEPDPVPTGSVMTSLSQLGLEKSKEEPVQDSLNQEQTKKNPLWNAMVNLS
jgi:hypothetical protein